MTPTRPACYDLDEIPMRTEKQYWDTIKELLDKRKTKRQHEAITKDSGISRMPLAAASPAFIHPSYYPIDPFHIYFQNGMPHIWDMWRGSSSNDKVHVTEKRQRNLESLLQVA